MACGRKRRQDACRGHGKPCRRVDTDGREERIRRQPAAHVRPRRDRRRQYRRRILHYGLGGTLRRQERFAARRGAEISYPCDRPEYRRQFPRRPHIGQGLCFQRRVEQRNGKHHGTRRKDRDAGRRRNAICIRSRSERLIHGGYRNRPHRPGYIRIPGRSHGSLARRPCAVARRAGPDRLDATAARAIFHTYFERRRDNRRRHLPDRNGRSTVLHSRRSVQERYKLLDSRTGYGNRQRHP